ncbi:MAG: DNA adenine methylase [Euryarchaeota archaeon]|nr:DNA adenine methylase [Euryarchaeota archaeon]
MSAFSDSVDTTVISPFRYPGGKYYATKHLLPFINAYDHDEYREPFLGGGTIFFAKRRVPYNWLNDLDDNLMATYRIMADPELSQKLAARMQAEVASPTRHAELKAFGPSNDFEIAFKTYYLNRTSYSGIINKPAWGYRESQSAPPGTWGEKIRKAHEKLLGAKLTDRDFSLVLEAPPRGKRVLMYLDPPYFHADQKRAYTKPFKASDHLRLARALKVLDAGFCLSYDDCPEVRDFYRWAHVYERSWLYNTSNLRGQRRKTGNELVITNYPVRQIVQSPLPPTVTSSVRANAH